MRIHPLIFACFALLSGIWAPTAFADRPAGLDQSVASAHFVIHFTTSGPSAVDQQGATLLLTSAERVYDLEVGQWGWPAPLDDGDGKTDVYIEAIEGPEAGSAASDATGSRVPGHIIYGTKAFATGHGTVTDVLIGHEFLHVLQMGRNTVPLRNTFIREALAFWASARTLDSDWIPVPWFRSSLDCDSAAACHQPDGDGQSNKWTFFEYLAERFGPSVMGEIWDDASALGTGFDPLAAIDRTLVRHGSGLEAIWNDYATAEVWNDFTIAGAQQSHAVPVAATLAAGKQLAVAVDHLDIGYAAIRNVGATTCVKGSLRVTVAFAAGIGAQPALTRWLGLTSDKRPLYERPTRLTADASGASIVVPWWACHDSGTLVLPNPSRQDGVTFIVTVAFIPPATCLVPQLAGLSGDEARQALNGAGCALGRQLRVASPPALNRRAVRQSLDAGTKVPGGTRVTIYVGNGKQRGKR